MALFHLSWQLSGLSSVWMFCDAKSGTLHWGPCPSRLKMPADIITIVLAGLAPDTLSRHRRKARVVLVAIPVIAANLLAGLFLLHLKEMVKVVF